jgi:hypothetical protein
LIGKIKSLRNSATHLETLKRERRRTAVAGAPSSSQDVWNDEQTWIFRLEVFDAVMIAEEVIAHSAESGAEVLDKEQRN